MKIYTLNVGQGQFVVVAGKKEAIVVDTYVPLTTEQDVVNVKSALASILQGKELIGLMVTGFDSDHFNEVGMKIVLNKYRPNWIMYPKYFKKTKTADTCFDVIGSFESQKKFDRVSVRLENNDIRFYNELSSEFSFEVFSPHSADMDSSNNCSLVCRIHEVASNRTYLVTGDAENSRWDSIEKHFGNYLASDVLAAPHHGSSNGITASAFKCIQPHTVLISAGVDNQYGHPDQATVQLFKRVANNVYSTNWGDGQSLVTEVSATGTKTLLFKP